MRRMIILLIPMLMLIAGVIYLLYPCRRAASSAYGGTACVKKTRENYRKGLAKFNDNLHKPGVLFAALVTVGRDHLTRSRRKVTAPIVNAGSHPRFIEDLDLDSLTRSCLYPPYGVLAASFHLYPEDYKPSYCEGITPIQPDQLPTLGRITTPSLSVGRLKIRSMSGSSTVDMWGTAFVIAKDVIATPCHVIDSLLVKNNGKWRLQVDEDESLVVDFKEHRLNRNQNPADEFKVTSWLGCGFRDGLDIALLAVNHTNANGDALPQPMMLYAGPESSVIGDVSAVVGYADLDHPIDADTQEMYSPYLRTEYEEKDQDYAKFAMIDSMVSIDVCDDELSLELDTADTTMGESGSPVMDLFPDRPNRAALVVGVHTCCAAYFEYSKGTPPEHELPASRLRRTYNNQDVSIISILKDHDLCTKLLEAGSVDLRNYDGTPVANFACR